MHVIFFLVLDVAATTVLSELNMVDIPFIQATQDQVRKKYNPELLSLIDQLY